MQHPGLHTHAHCMQCARVCACICACVCACQCHAHCMCVHVRAFVRAHAVGRGARAILTQPGQAWPAAQTAHMRIWSCFKSAQTGQTLPGHAAVHGQATPVPAARGSARVPLPTARAAPTHSGRGIGKLTQCAGPAHPKRPCPLCRNRILPRWRPRPPHPPSLYSYTRHSSASSFPSQNFSIGSCASFCAFWWLACAEASSTCAPSGARACALRACMCVCCVHVCVPVWGGVGWGGARAPPSDLGHRGATHVVPGRHALLALLVRARRLRVGDRLLDGRLAGLRGERGEKRARGCHRGGNFLRSHAHGGRRPTRHPPAATANAHAPARRAAGWAAPRARSARAWGRAGRRRWAWPPSCWCGP